MQLKEKSLLQAPVVLRCPSLREAPRCWICNFPCAWPSSQRRGVRMSEPFGLQWPEAWVPVFSTLWRHLLGFNWGSSFFSWWSLPAESVNSIPKWVVCLAVEGFLHFSLYPSFSFFLLLLLSLLGRTSWSQGVFALNVRCRHVIHEQGWRLHICYIHRGCLCPGGSMAGLSSLVQLPLLSGSGFWILQYAEKVQQVCSEVCL